VSSAQGGWSHGTRFGEREVDPYFLGCCYEEGVCFDVGYFLGGGGGSGRRAFVDFLICGRERLESGGTKGGGRDVLEGKRRSFVFV
jgi:hypothetical protein